MEVNLPKRKEIRTRLPISESPMEYELKHQFLKLGIRPQLQYPIGPFFADFAFPEIKLIVEYDGSFHERQKEKDASRNNYIKSQGWQIIRVNKNFINYPDINYPELNDLFSSDTNFLFQIVAKTVKKMLLEKSQNLINYAVGNTENGFKKISLMDWVKQQSWWQKPII